MENRVHIEIAPDDLTALQEAIGVLNTTLGPMLKTLDVQERRTLPKMGDGTEPFVTKTIEYAKTNAQFLPPFVSVDEMEVDFKSVEDLQTVLRPMKQLVAGLEDTIMLAGSEAYVSALSYYNSVKIGQKMNMPGAETIYKDLKKRFDKRGSGKNNEMENPS